MCMCDTHADKFTAVIYNLVSTKTCLGKKRTHNSLFFSKKTRKYELFLVHSKVNLYFHHQ